MERFDTLSVAEVEDVIAPDGSAVRPLCRLPGIGSFARFELRAGEVSAAVSHRTVQEIWYVIGGSGAMWRRHGEREETVTLRPGVCVTIPLGTAFQFRAGDDGLLAVAVTAPPWPLEDTGEAVPEHGPWAPDVPGGAARRSEVD